MEDSAPPQLIEDLSQSCLRAVDKALGISLDGSPETLSILDHYLREQAGQVANKSDIVGLVAPMAGAYFGEVVRNEFSGARWHAPAEKYEDWRIEFEQVFLFFNPLGVALEALMGRTVGAYGASFRVRDSDKAYMEEALKVLGPIREEDFFRTTIRMECLEQIHHRLLERAQTQGEAARRYMPEEYKAFAERSAV